MIYIYLHFYSKINSYSFIHSILFCIITVHYYLKISQTTQLFETHANKLF